MNVLIMYAKAGGGHESVAKALAEGFKTYYPDVSVSLIDIVGEYSPFPINRFPEIYPKLTKGHGTIWRLIYYLTDGNFQTNTLFKMWWPILRKRIEEVMKSINNIDLIISVYPLLNKALGEYISRMDWYKPVYAIQITDLGTAHAFWISRYANIYLVPTLHVYSRLLHLGVPKEKIYQVGLPVDLRFFNNSQNKRKLREKLNLCSQCPVILVIGGAEGMGNLERIIEALNERKIHAEFVVVTGRNKHLQRKLSSKSWTISVKVLGYVKNLYEWMKASDLLLTKAGPSTISEALTVGLPMVITGYLPGQEKSNVDFLKSIGAGIYESHPRKIAEFVEWLVSNEGRDALKNMRLNAYCAKNRNSTKMSIDILYRKIKEKYPLKSNNEMIWDYLSR